MKDIKLRATHKVTGEVEEGLLSEIIEKGLEYLQEFDDYDWEVVGSISRCTGCNKQVGEEDEVKGGMCEECIEHHFS